jgi:hypothetical protein
VEVPKASQPYVLVRAWSGIGPLIGALIGSWLTRSWQRKQWLLESKKAEYRELLSVLSQSAHCILNNSPHLTVQGMGTLKSGEQERESDEAAADGSSLYAVWQHQSDTALLRVTLDSKISPLLRSSDPEILGAIPSPYGRSIAIAGASTTRNVWQIKDFR